MMFQKKRMVILSIFSIVAIALYLQMSFQDSFVDKGQPIQVDSAKDRIQSSGPEYVEKGTEEGGNFIGNDFFSEAKLQREINQGKSKDLIKDILSNANLNPEVKQEAVESMQQLVQNYENESKIETLVKEKGYRDVFATIGKDGSVDLVVKAPSLNGTEVASLADIASRYGNTSIQKVYIKNKN